MSFKLGPSHYFSLRGIVLSVVIVSGAGLWLWNDYWETLESAATQQANVARLLETHTSHVIANADAILDRVMDETRDHDIMGKGAEQRWPVLVEMAKRLPVSGRLWLYRADGSAVMASHLRHSTNNATDREYFNAQKTPGVGLFIGETVIGKTTGRKVFNLSRRIDTPDGAFAGVAMAAIDIDVFIQAVTKLKLGESAAYTLVRGDGAIIMRYPDAGATGKRFNLNVLEEMKRQPEGLFMAVSLIDGVTRQVAYRKHAEYPLAIVVSLSRNEILMPWRHRAIAIAGGLALLLVIMSWLAFVARRATRQEQNAVAKMKAIIETEPECIKIIDAEGRLTFMNPAGLRMIEADSLALVKDHPVLNLIAPEFRVDYARLHQQVLNGEPARMQYEVVGLKGGRRWLETHAVPMMSDGERVHLAVTRDITEKKQAEDELERYRLHLESLVQERTQALSIAKEAAEAANRAKTIFLSTMTHELHTPMNGIIGMTGLALRRATDSKQAEQLQKVTESSKRLLAIINDILDYSKAESERFNLENVNFMPADVLNEQIGHRAHQAAEKGIRFSLELATELAGLTVHGDPNYLSHVLDHLVDNAIKFTAEGSVTLRARLEEAGPEDVLMRFEIEDTGIGISAEDQKRLFSAFEQADGSLTRKHGGIGLGLALSKRLVQAMGGTIGVVSHEGQGSLFWFTARFGRAGSRDAV
jgi:PAS domain S-box-containing protein